MLLTAERIVHEGFAYGQMGIEVDARGRIAAVAPLDQLGKPDVNLRGRILLPGLVNAHSQAYQRLLRGRVQTVDSAADAFLGWRQASYAVATSLDPRELYLAARHMFLEMALCGTTTVGEFHYLHHQPNGQPYDNPFAMADALVYAARDVGIRLAVIHAIYLRSDFNKGVDAAEARFVAPSLDAACDAFDGAVERIISYNDARLTWAVAAHSLRAMPIEAVVGLKVRLGHMPFHIQVSQQRGEVQACLEHHGMGPVELLARSEICDACTTLVHATHLRPGEAEAIADSGAVVCACPSTDADLGAGLGAVSGLFSLGVSLCLGSGSQVQSSMLEEANQTEMHERLRTEHRNVIAHHDKDNAARHLLHMATVNGAVALGADVGAIRPGRWADFAAFDLQDPAVAGANDETLLSALLFSASTRHARDVMVAGKFIVEDWVHPLQAESRGSFDRLTSKVFPR